MAGSGPFRFKYAATRGAEVQAVIETCLPSFEAEKMLEVPKWVNASV